MTTIDSAKLYIKLIEDELKKIVIKQTILKIESTEIDNQSISTNGTNVIINPIDIDLDLDTEDYLDRSILETEK